MYLTGSNLLRVIGDSSLPEREGGGRVSSCPLNNLSADAIDTPYRRNYPDIIADAYLAVGAGVAKEGKRRFRLSPRPPFPGGSRMYLTGGGRVCGVGGESTIIYCAAEVRGDIMVVHELSFSDVACGVANGVAVLDDVLALGDITQGELMARRDSGQVLQGYGHRIRGIYL